MHTGLYPLTKPYEYLNWKQRHDTSGCHYNVQHQPIQRYTFVLVSHKKIFCLWIYVHATPDDFTGHYTCTQGKNVNIMIIV